MKHISNNRLCSILVGLFLLGGCASPSTPSTMPWQLATQQFSIKPVSPGMYQMDQFVVTYEALTAMLQREIANGHQPNIIIVRAIMPITDEEIRIAELAEKHGLNVYSSGLFGFTKTSSEEIRTEAEEEALW